MKHRIRLYFIASFIVSFTALLLAGCTPAGDDDSAPGAQPGQSLGIASIPNLRDLGGYETRDGKTIKPGLLYRSNQLSGISPEDMQKLGALGLQGAYDLRTTEERETRPKELPPGVDYIVVDVLADSPAAGPA